MQFTIAPSSFYTNTSGIAYIHIKTCHFIKFSLILTHVSTKMSCVITHHYKLGNSTTKCTFRELCTHRINDDH